MDKSQVSNTTERNNEGGYIQMPGAGRTIQLGEISVVFKAESKDSGGAWSLAEYTIPPKSTGPPAHSHESELQAFYVLSGTVAFSLGQHTNQLPAGSFVLVPPAVVHALRNDQVVPATILLLATPGGLEGYFEDLAELMKIESIWPPADTTSLHVLMQRYGRRLDEDTNTL